MHSYVISCAFHNYKHFVIFPHIFFPQKHFKVNNQYQDMGFHGSSVQEILQARKYWSRLPFPPSGDLPNSGIEPGSTALQVDSSLSEPPGKPSVSGSGEKTTATKNILVRLCLKSFPLSHPLLRERECFWCDS